MFGTYDWRDVFRESRNIPDAYMERGPLSQLGKYFLMSEPPFSFMLSGGDTWSRQEAVDELLYRMIGEIPLILLDGDGQLMRQVYGIWRMKSDEWQRPCCPLWNLGPENSSGFEPFLGMSAERIVEAVSNLGKEQGYTVTPALDRVVRAHISALELMGTSVSLSGFHYLCGIEDMDTLGRMIRRLPKGGELWKSMGVDDEDHSQFDLFRAVLRGFAGDAAASGWLGAGSVRNCNCLQALRNNAAMVMTVGGDSARRMLTYLASELEGFSRTVPALLLMENVNMESETFCDKLAARAGSWSVGIMGNNVPGLLRDENTFHRVCAGMKQIAAMKQSIYTSAETFSKVMGTFDTVQASVNKGSHARAFECYDDSHDKGIHYERKEEYRCRPQELMDLGAGETVILNTEDNALLFYEGFFEG